MIQDLTTLHIDHPGATDPVYRARRNDIARLARTASSGGPPPHLEYLQEEDETWRTAFGRLLALHERYACAIHLEARQALGIPADRIPQLADLDGRLASMTGFRIRAIEGLIEPCDFLGALEDRVMSSTQYIRHASRPEYTPEPDIVHEVIGHIPMLADPVFAELSTSIGRAARSASDEQMVILDRLYWFTLEFGLVEEGGERKAYGAGLLSSYGELKHAFSTAVEVRPFDMDAIAAHAYNFSDMQQVLYVIPSFEFLIEEVRRLTDRW